MKDKLLLPSNKSFGLTFSCLFFISAIVFRDNIIFLFLLISLSFIFLVISYFKPNALKNLNYFWMLIAQKIGNVASIIICILIFYILITPIGIVRKIYYFIMNIFNSKKKLKTFWIKKNNEIEYKDQF